MRLLVVSQYFWPETFRINDLTRELVSRGHSVTVLTGMPNYPTGKLFPGYGLFKTRRECYCGAEVIRIPLVTRGAQSNLRLVLNYMSFAVVASIVGPLVCRQEFDVILVWQLSPVTSAIPALVLRRMKRIPVVMWVLDLWPESVDAIANIHSRRLLEIVKLISNGIYRRADKLLVSSEGFFANLCSRGIPSDRIEYLPNWVEPEYRSGHCLSRQIPKLTLPRGFRIMFAGNIGAAQDFESILGAAERLRVHRDIHMIILGDGRRFEWLQAEVNARSLSDQVILLGRYPPGMMPSLFAEADAMLVTLRKNPLFAITVPGKIQSYMACGKPIVAAIDGEGARLINEAGVGFVVSAEDATGLAGAILRMYQLPSGERAAMGARGQTYCEAKFGRAMLLDRLDSCLEAVKDASHPGAVRSDGGQSEGKTRAFLALKEVSEPNTGRLVNASAIRE